MAQQIDAVNEEIARKIRIAGLERARKLASTGALSRKKEANSLRCSYLALFSSGSAKDSTGSMAIGFGSR